MKTAAISDERLKTTVKSALLEVFEDRKDLLAEIVEEAIADFALASAIRKGERTPAVSRDRVFAALGKGS